MRPPLPSSPSSLRSDTLQAADFDGLFDRNKSEVDRKNYDDICVRELTNFKMDPTRLGPSPYGVPLYMTFSCVSVTVVSAKNLIGMDFNLLGKRTSDPYVVIDLVHYETRRVVNRKWYHRTPTQRATLEPHWEEKSMVKWKVITIP